MSAIENYKNGEPTILFNVGKSSSGIPELCLDIDNFEKLMISKKGLLELAISTMVKHHQSLSESE